MDRAHREGGDQHLVVLHLVGDRVDPVALGMLQRQELAAELLAPVVAAAAGIDDGRLAQDA